MSGKQQTERNSHGTAPMRANYFINEKRERRNGRGPTQPRKFDAAGSGQPSLLFLQRFDEIIKDTNIPHFLREHRATLRFPEILFVLLAQAERESVKKGHAPENGCISWSMNGMTLIIRNQEELINELLPLDFCKTKFSSFIRKLYRWGFRQVIGQPLEQIRTTGEKVFWHPQFHRHDKPVAMGMKSTTAEGTRRAVASHIMMKQQDPRSSAMLDSQYLTSSTDRRENNIETTPTAAALASFAQRYAERATPRCPTSPFTSAVRDPLTSLAIPHHAPQCLTSIHQSLRMTDGHIVSMRPTVDTTAWSTNLTLENHWLVHRGTGAQPSGFDYNSTNTDALLRAIIGGSLPDRVLLSLLLH